MSTSTAATTGGGGGGVGGALSLMGCVREASPPPQNHHHHHHHHRTLGLGEFSAQASVDPLPKEPKKRRFHPLRGLRKIFRRKSRGAADVRLTSGPSDRDAELARMPREDVTMRHPAGRPEEARSRSASELLTDSCDRESSSSRSIRSAKRRRVATPVKSRRSFKHVFLRRSGMEDSFTKLRGGAGKLSVSHDSVFPGEVPSTRPLSSLDSLATLERRQGRKSNEIEHKEYNQHVAQRHRISLRVLEQIKTVIENRNQLASATSTDSSGTTAHSAAGERYQQETAENRFGNFEKHDRNAEESNQAKITRPAKDSADRIVPVPKEDLPQFESASLNHTAALHRISVRPKNRRPPRRSTSQTNTSTTSASTITTIAEDVLDSLEPEQQSQHKDNGNINNINLNNINNNINNNNTTTVIANNNNNNNNNNTNNINNYINNANNNNNNNANNNNNNSPNSSNASSPTEPKSISVTRKSSSRLSRTSDIFEELESRFPRKPSSVVSLSPDSLDAANAPSRTSVETVEDQPEVRSVTRKPSNRISKGSDVFEELESKLPRRRSSSNRLSKSPDSLEVASCWFSKSTEGFDLLENEESKPVAARRQLSQISKSTDRVSKSSDSLEAIEALASDDSIERRRCSFEFRARRSSKVMSKSSESFEVLEQHAQNVVETMPDLQKRSSVSDINLARGARRLSKSTSKSSESFEKIERMEISESKDEIDEDDQSARSCRRSSKRMSSESSDNLELDDRLENRRVRRTPKRIPSTSVVDIMPADDHEEERRPTPTRKPSRLQKSSESSELGSTDTLDSERRNKSSESTETLDSLEKDLEQDRKEEEIMDSVVDRREKNDSWSNRTVPDTEQMPMADGVEDSKPLISPDKFYWRQTSDTKENIDIHQLLAITIVTRMADNGNNQRNSVIYPKKKQQMSASPPTSPVANKQQEDNKTIFDNLLASKNDEDLQNMLNGNISEVSTDTKSFKEKLIMFEKLGK